MEKQKRGFACMTKEKRSAIARLGGAAVPPEKRSFSQDSKLARSAGRTGGLRKGVHKVKDPAKA